MDAKEKSLFHIEFIAPTDNCVCRVGWLAIRAGSRGVHITDIMDFPNLAP
ncbi:hypothetical protein OKW43_006597 [Paraburkholderia sp. WC7.3g]